MNDTVGVNDAPGRSPRFAFGRNWDAYLRSAFNPAREASARESVIRLVGASNLQGRTFLDVGCGSGIFSLAAFRLGATVLSFDVDPQSVACCRQLRTSAGSPASWTVLEGSVLDDEFVHTLPTADIVYSWGVLHHTGDMWRALRLAASRVEPGGLLCVALYNKVESRAGGSRLWWAIKGFYVRQPRVIQILMEWTHAAYRVAVMIGTLRNPVRVARTYHQERGMSLWHDWIDWLGGYPYEYASAGEVFDFGRNTLGFQLLRMHTTSSLGCSEYVFQRPADGAERSR